MPVTVARDERIARAIRTEMELSPQLSGGRISVSVEGGRVTIRGKVRDKAEALAASSVARRIRGVSGITDKTEIATDEIEQVDRHLADAAEGIIAKTLEDARLKVSVRDRDVTLRGWIPAGVDRAPLIRALADIQGARSIIDDMEVAVHQTELDDRAVQSRIINELSRNPLVAAGHIGVAVDNGVVSLSGTVRSDAERDAARECAFRVPGVQSIADSIRTEGEAFPLSDTALAAEVQAVLRGNSRLRGLGVTAELVDGTAVLRGTVPHPVERDLVARVVGRLSNIRGVDNRIQVESRDALPSVTTEETKAASVGAAIGG